MRSFARSAVRPAFAVLPPSRGLCDTGRARGVAQPGSALRSGRRGPQFESGHPDDTRSRAPRLPSRPGVEGSHHVRRRPPAGGGRYCPTAVRQDARCPRPLHMRLCGLCAVQALTVLGPRPSPRLIRRSPPRPDPAGRDRRRRAAAGRASPTRRSAHRPGRDRDAGRRRTAASSRSAADARWASLAAPVLYLIAWKGDGPPAQIATDALIAVAPPCTLAWLTGTVAPRTAPDRRDPRRDRGGRLPGARHRGGEQAVSQALSARSPPPGCRGCRSSSGAPPPWAGATLPGGAARRRGRDLGAADPAGRGGAPSLLLGVASGFLFHVLDTLPATVPVAARPIASPWRLTLPFLRHKEEVLMATTQTAPRRAAPDRRRVGRGSGGGRFDVTNPANGEVVGSRRTRPPTTCARDRRRRRGARRLARARRPIERARSCAGGRR